MSTNPVYLTDINQGFVNGENDIVYLDSDNIIQREYGSNCTFLGLSKAIEPRAFNSICRPLYVTRNKFETMMYAVEYSNTLSALKKANANYSFYLPGNDGIGLGGDSSLVRIVTNPELNQYYFQGYNLSNGAVQIYSESDLRRKILNQIGITVPSANGSSKEFIQNLGGNYIVLNHDNGTVSGTATTKFGLQGDSAVNIVANPYNEDTDNGQVYIVDYFFNFLGGSSYYGLFINRYPKFLQLLGKAGLFDNSFLTFPFLISGESYTVLAPTDEALNECGADTLNKEDLENFLRYHFIKGDMIFTDGKKISGSYQTVRIDEQSSGIQTINSKIKIQTGPDVIQIIDNEGNVYLEIEESDVGTNQLITYDTNPGSDSPWDYITTGVVHTVNKALNIDSLRVE
jgi:hypothetical protein